MQGKEPGFTDLIVHCDDGACVFVLKTPKGDIALTPKEVGDYVKSLNLPPNEGIRLVSCNAGYSSSGPGAALQAELGGRAMKVAPAPVAIEADGSLHFINPGIVNGKYSVYDPAMKWKDLP